jgi:hypothetical protein
MVRPTYVQRSGENCLFRRRYHGGICRLGGVKVSEHATGPKDREFEVDRGEGF